MGFDVDKAFSDDHTLSCRGSGGVGRGGETADKLISESVSPSPHAVVLTPQLLEELTTSTGKPRLKVARDILLKRENLEEIGFSSFEESMDVGQELYSQWRDVSEYLVLHKEYVGKGDLEDQWIAVKCSKRGNDVYERRIKTRLGWLNRKIPEKVFFKAKDFKTHAIIKSSLLWVTLTYDPSRGDLIYAWENVGHDFNRYISSLRRKFGKISYFRVWEAYESGYPHIHLIVLFHEKDFEVYPHSDRDDKLTFRIKEKSDISDPWHSFVDVQAISSLSALFTYIKKHQEKVILGLSGSIQDHGLGDPTVGFDLENIRGLRTLFLCWIFRKRSFSVSGDFQEKISDLISHLHNSNMVGQRDLEGNLVVEWVWHFLGVFSGSELGIPSGIWTKQLEKGEVERLLEGRNWKK